MKAVQFLFKLKHGLKPATIRRTVMKKFGGICEGRRPVQHPAFDETTLFRKIKDRNTIASDGNGSLRGRVVPTHPPQRVDINLLYRIGTAVSCIFSYNTALYSKLLSEDTKDSRL
jgi:hypothetical protein